EMGVEDGLDELPSRLVGFAVLVDVLVEQISDGLGALGGFALLLALALFLPRQVDSADCSGSYFLGARPRLGERDGRIGPIGGACALAALGVVADRPRLQNNAVFVSRRDPHLEPVRLGVAIGVSP